MTANFYMFRPLFQEMHSKHPTTSKTRLLSLKKWCKDIIQVNNI